MESMNVDGEPLKKRAQGKASCSTAQSLFSSYCAIVILTWCAQLHWSACKIELRRHINAHLLCYIIELFYDFHRLIVDYYEFLICFGEIVYGNLTHSLGASWPPQIFAHFESQGTTTPIGFQPLFFSPLLFIGTSKVDRTYWCLVVAGKYRLIVQKGPLHSGYGVSSYKQICRITQKPSPAIYGLF